MIGNRLQNVTNFCFDLLRFVSFAYRLPIVFLLQRMPIVCLSFAYWCVVAWLRLATFTYRLPIDGYGFFH